MSATSASQAASATKAPAKPKLCQFSQYSCSKTALQGYSYCLRHILEDPAAPYRQCSYVYPGNSRRCVMPTPKDDKATFGLCSEHARKSQIARQRTLRRHKPPPTTETLLLSLVHYVRPGTRKAGESTSQSSLGTGAAQETGTVVKALNPFVDINAAKVNQSVCRVLDYASESESDVEGATVDTAWHSEDYDSSDAESVDSQQEDPLKYSGVYTVEEISIIMREKLIRLQSLYIEQFRRLQHVLKERRRRYLHALKKEKETLSSIHNQPKETIKEQKLYAKLKALNSYHRRSGIEAVMHKKELERRALATEGVTVRPAHIVKCVFTEGGVKCGERTLPSARHCRKHILHDNHQVLFRACGCTQADIQCKEPVLNIFEGASCVYHTNLPPPPKSTISTTLPDLDVGGQDSSSLELRDLKVESSDDMACQFDPTSPHHKDSPDVGSSTPGEAMDYACDGGDASMKQEEVFSETATDIGSSDTTLTAHSDMDESYEM
ncbi:KAT8 regulatory NSL complex subunit 2 [Bacillus rossius redtenbacheri]|uniref:KAT8 regulatory NSL complex subunit 2 n=1 Tax=Bacillus rossius redtenbacheri TaxID=93214 RepID=UPI002FDD9208